MNSKIKVVLLVGGTSPEREVSKSSCKSIFKALLKLGYDTHLIDPAYGSNQPKSSDDFFADENYSEISNSNYLDALSLPVFNNANLVFIGLHGKWGEDGTIQSMLELKGLAYTGSKVLSSSLAMDKIMSKILFDEYNVYTPKWFSIKNGERNSDEVHHKIESELGYPVIVKPNDQGSTVGLSVCRSKNELDDAIKLAYDYSDRVLIEEFIPGREMTVGVLDGKALSVLEIKPKHELYDYECKYTAGMSEYIVPAPIPKSVFENLQKVAELAYKALRCEVYARVDFRLNPDNKPYALEVNTLPGMTSLSLVPKMAAADGINFESLIDEIVKLSLK